ncbi:olfactory receptor 52K1-like [Pelodytes ibericus]
MANQSEGIQFVITGFPGLPREYHLLVSLLIFLFYVMALMANGTVIALIIMKEHLHQPMYLLIGNLALSELLLDTVTLPKLLAMYWFGDGRLSLSGCLFQMFCVHSLGMMDCFTIMMMAFDRYVAICKPLRYPTIVTNKVVIVVCVFVFLLASALTLSIVLIAADLTYCGTKKVSSCFCISPAITSLACTDFTAAKRNAFIIAMFVLLLPLALIISSYVVIITTIRSSAHHENWQKAFYTCTTHLLVNGLFFIPRIFVYMASQVRLILNADLNVLLLWIYTFVPHLANPVIYCLRTKEIKKTLLGLFQSKARIKEGETYSAQGKRGKIVAVSTLTSSAGKN